ncbi:serine hydrolase domain-containing protein [Phenylobacterium sp.]|jgi:CubicO group peptidase (beta-lactamase class C family)|uniref:serine hydrolase domain-containing protein n=1 Tax=Phenylobacterium sp. TaxID=1871053 RepID=UPI002F3F1389
MSASGLSKQRLARLDAAMQRFVDEGNFAGVLSLVWRRGEVAHVHPAGWRDLAGRVPMQRDTIFRIASMTKPVVSAAVLVLVEEGRLRLADPVARWLPEVADARVLRAPHATLDDTVPAVRAPTLHDLLTHTGGFSGRIGAETPLTRAMREIDQGPWTPHEPDEFVRRIGALPLVAQPGTAWHYGVSTDLLGVVVARAGGRSLPAFLQERIFQPLGMADTAFFVPPGKQQRLSAAYARDAEGRLALHEPRAGHWSAPPVFPAGGSGLVSTADDYLAFARMLLGGGRLGRERVLSRPAVALMTANHLSAGQIRPLFPAVDFLHGRGFGLGVSVSFAADTVLGSAGKFGWPGAYTTGWFADPHEDLIGLVMTQLWLDARLEIRPTFENLAYQAIDD